jgi:hypothetical protein
MVRGSRLRKWSAKKRKRRKGRIGEGKMDEMG